MSSLATWQVWWADLNPHRGHEQAGHRPVLIISSAFHLRVMAARLVTVHPMTTTRRGWPQHVAVATPGKTGYVMTEQIRTISADRLTGAGPHYRLTPAEITAVREYSQLMLG